MAEGIFLEPKGDLNIYKYSYNCDTEEKKVLLFPFMFLKEPGH